MSVIPDRFTGCTVVVTGAGSGIGAATAARIAREGGRVVATDLVAERLEQLVADLAGADVVTVAGDVAARDVTDAVIAAADGRVDGLVNNAGIMDRFLPTAELDDETWERVMGVNVTAPMRLMRGALRHMLDAGRGAIVNVASEAALRSSAAGTAYAASKHALVGLTTSTAFFYGPKGIRCNAVAPGAVATNIESPFGSAWAQERLGPFMQTAIPGVATADQLAAAITWLLSDDSTNVNGVVLPSDGGWCVV